MPPVCPIVLLYEDYNIFIITVISVHSCAGNDLLIGTVEINICLANRLSLYSVSKVSIASICAVTGLGRNIYHKLHSYNLRSDRNILWSIFDSKDNYISLFCYINQFFPLLICFNFGYLSSHSLSIACGKTQKVYLLYMAKVKFPSIVVIRRMCTLYILRNRNWFSDILI